MEGNMCLWRGESILTETDRRSPMKKAEKSRKNNLSLWRGIGAHEGKGQGFWLKLMGGFPMKKGWKSRKKTNLSLWKGKSAYEGESKSFHQNW